MAALINAVSTGKLKATETPNYQPVMAAPEASNQPETTEKVRGSLTNPHISSNNAQVSHFNQIYFCWCFPLKTMGQIVTSTSALSLAGDAEGPNK